MRLNFKTILLILAVVLVLAYIVVMSVVPKTHDADHTICRSVICVFEDSTEHRYMSDQQVLHYLHTCGLNPIGKQQSDLSLQAMEDTLLAHPIITSADCYMTIDGDMHINLTQCTPVAHVMTDTENYFVGSDRGLIPAWSTINDTVLEVRGTLTHAQSCGEVADFAEWLAADTIWRDRVDYLWLPEEHKYTLLLVGDTTRILLGNLTEYRKQLRRLQRFYELGQEQLKQKSYSQLDLRFDDQVIGRN